MNRQRQHQEHIITCLKTAFVAVAGDDANRSGVDTGADKTVHVIVDQVFDLKIIKHKRSTKSNDEKILTKYIWTKHKNKNVIRHDSNTFGRSHDATLAHLFELNEPGFGELDGSTLSDSLDGHKLALVQRQRRKQLRCPVFCGGQ